MCVCVGGGGGEGVFIAIYALVYNACYLLLNEIEIEKGGEKQIIHR